MVELETPADIIDKAVDIIKKRGWTRRALVDATGKVCLLGALNCAVFDNPRIGHVPGAHLKNTLKNSAATCVEDSITIKEKVQWNLIYWNDIPSRTPRQVLALLRHASKECKKNVHS